MLPGSRSTFMRKILLSLFIPLLLLGCVNPKPVNEANQLKADLIGHTMGGRESTWKFQSVHQIKDLTVTGRIESNASKEYFVTLVLHDDKVQGTYLSDAKITYQKGINGKWKVVSVGELSIKKL